MKRRATAVWRRSEDPTRRRIFERLGRRAQPVGKLAATLAVTRPAVSQHLRVLEAAGLVTHARSGTRHVYRVDARGVEIMRSWLDKFWERALGAFAAEAEASYDDDAEP